MKKLSNVVKTDICINHNQDRIVGLDPIISSEENIIFQLSMVEFSNDNENVLFLFSNDVYLCFLSKSPISL